jgi:lambda repressor-like predicted transcriptional regulator
VIEHRSHPAGLEDDPPTGWSLSELGRNVCCVDGTFALWMTVPFRATTQICVSAIETSKPAKILHRRFSSSNNRADPIVLWGRAADHYPMLKK